MHGAASRRRRAIVPPVSPPHSGCGSRPPVAQSFARRQARPADLPGCDPQSRERLQGPARRFGRVSSHWTGPIPSKAACRAIPIAILNCTVSSTPIPLDTSYIGATSTPNGSSGGACRKPRLRRWRSVCPSAQQAARVRVSIAWAELGFRLQRPRIVYAASHLGSSLRPQSYLSARRPAASLAELLLVTGSGRPALRIEIAVAPLAQDRLLAGEYSRQRSGGRDSEPRERPLADTLDSRFSGELRVVFALRDPRIEG